MKSGANILDVRQIQEGYKKGMSTGEISDRLRINPTTVESFQPSKIKGTKVKVTPRAKDTSVPAKDEV